MSKRILSLVLALVMVLGTFGTVFAAEPTNNDRVNKLIELGLVKGDGTGYRLNDTIRRDEVAAMVVRSMDLESVANAMVNVPTKFVDVKAGEWNNGYVAVAEGRGITKGTGANTFSPARPITYSEVAAMLVRVLNGLTADEEKVAVWPATYIAKAHEMGILADVAIANMNEMAVRERVFEMVYNTITHKDANLVIASTVEGIVVENYRTERLAKDDIVVHVMKDQVQRSSSTYDSTKYYEENDEFKVTLDAKLREKGLDVETLLGKVVKVSFDKDGKVVGIEINKDYDYKHGKLEDITSKQIKVDGKFYTVGKEEARTAFDERLYQVYQNNGDIAYNKLEAEYANITVRNGKVLFIDAFNFADIAPVAKDITDKNMVAYYDDARDGEMRNLEVKDSAYVINFEKGEMKLGNNKDIEANDVMHWYTDGNKVLTVIVRPAADNAVKGVYTEANAASARDSSKVNIVVDKEDYPAVIKNEKRDAVYSLTSSSYEFARLTGLYDLELRPFVKEDVVLALDMFGNVQLISSDVIDNSFYAMVVRVLNNEFRLLKGDNTKEYYSTNIRDTEFYAIGADGDTQEAKKTMFTESSLVLATAKEDLLTEVTLIPENAYTVDDFNKNFIELNGDRFYTSNSTIVFVEDGADSVAMSVSAFLKDYKTYDANDNWLVPNMEAYVALNAKDDQVADVIVVLNAEEKAASTNTVVAKVSSVGMSGKKYYLALTQADGTKSTHEVLASEVYKVTTDPKISKGDIVEVKVTKDDDAKITSVAELLNSTGEVTYKVTKKSAGRVWLDGAEIRIAKDADIFGDYQVDDYVSVVVEDGLIIVIDVRDQNTAPVVDTSKELTIIDANLGIVKIGSRLYQVIGNMPAEGTVKSFKVQVLNGVEYIYDIVME